MCYCVRASVQIYMQLHAIYLSTYLPIYLSTDPSIQASIHPSIHLSIYVNLFSASQSLRRMVVAGATQACLTALLTRLENGTWQHKAASPFKLLVLAHWDVCHPASQVPFKGCRTYSIFKWGPCSARERKCKQLPTAPLYFSVFPVFGFST